MPQKHPSRTQKLKLAQQPSNQVQKSQQPHNSFKRNIIIALIGSPVLAAFVAGIFLFVNLLASKGAASSPAPTPVVTTPLISTPTPTQTPIPSPFVRGNFGVSSDNTNMVSLSVTPGDLLIVAVTQNERTPLGSNPVTDDKGDQYHEVHSVIANPDEQQDYAELYYAPHVKGGSTKVTVTFSKPADADRGDTNVGIYEFSGLSTTSPLDDYAWNQGTSSTSNNQPNTISSRGLNTSENNEMCFAVGVDSGPLDQNTNDNKTVLKGSGYKPLDLQEEWYSQERFYTEFAAPIVQGPAGCIPNFIINYSAHWAIISVAFKP